MIASDGLSPIAPPWTSLTAYDLNDGTIKWKIPLGEVPELAAKGIKNTGSHFPKVGPVVTAGGLIFTGTRDHKVRALDVDERECCGSTNSMPRSRACPPCMKSMAASMWSSARPPGPNPIRRHREKIRGAYVAFALPKIAAHAN